VYATTFTGPAWTHSTMLCAGRICVGVIRARTNVRWLRTIDPLAAFLSLCCNAMQPHTAKEEVQEPKGPHLQAPLVVAAHSLDWVDHQSPQQRGHRLVAHLRRPLPTLSRPRHKPTRARSSFVQPRSKPHELEQVVTHTRTHPWLT
jgi:hypothetical protein